MTYHGLAYPGLYWPPPGVDIGGPGSGIEVCFDAPLETVLAYDVARPSAVLWAPMTDLLDLTAGVPDVCDVVAVETVLPFEGPVTKRVDLTAELDVRLDFRSALPSCDDCDCED